MCWIHAETGTQHGAPQGMRQDVPHAILIEAKTHRAIDFTGIQHASHCIGVHCPCRAIKHHYARLTSAWRGKAMARKRIPDPSGEVITGGVVIVHRTRSPWQALRAPAATGAGRCHQRLKLTIDSPSSAVAPASKNKKPTRW